MVKLEQALILDPPGELHFKAPFTDVTTSYLKLSNPTDRQICYKLKTTAPKTYCVRPNSGIIPPHESATVAVMLQPIDTEAAEKSKHKFMVQSLFAPDGEVNQDILWRETLPENLMNSKLKCVFDIGHSSGSQLDVDSADMVDARNEEAGSASEVSAEGNPNSSPKISDTELKKAREENKQLTELLKSLRLANVQYKEEHLRWRRSKPTSAAATQSESLRPQETAMAHSSPPLFSKTNILVLVIVLIAGIILGKEVF